MKRTLAVFIIALTILPAVTAQNVDKPFVLVIDPGHGGKDPGAVNGKNQEKTINLNVALKMGKLIEDNCKGVKVIYTRKTDVFVELYKRADIANKAGADMFISIHTNSAKGKSANGAETYLLGVEENRASANLNVALEENRAIMFENDYETHYEGYDPNSPESMIIFEFMQNEFQKESLKMATMTQNKMTGLAHRPDRGVHQAGYLVLWKSAMPSILIELGFISNAEECKYLTSQKGVDDMAKSLYKAFEEYLADHNRQLGKAVTTSTATATAKETAKETTKETAKENKKEPKKQAEEARPIFKVQFMSIKEKIKENDKRIKGLANVSYYKEKDFYKYTCGDTYDYNAILETKKAVQKKYKDAFVIAFLNGQKISVKEAVELSKKKH